MNLSLLNKVKSEFYAKFGVEPISIFSPGRINFIGEHTDYNDGYVLPAAINKGIICAIQKSKNNFSTIIALDDNKKHTFSIDEIKPIYNGGWKNYILGILFEIKKTRNLSSNFDLVFAGDIPSGAGLSSSAALENSVVYGLNKVFNLGFNKEEMVFISQRAEHNFVGVKCGIMDQYTSMFGKKNKALFLDCRAIQAKAIKINFKEYHILLINSNVKHNLSSSAYNDRRLVCEKVAELLQIKALRDTNEDNLSQIRDKISSTDYQKVLYVIQENNRVKQAFKALKNEDLHLFGKLLYESHYGLKHQYNVSCDELDFLVDEAQKSEFVIGARMMGGGFGGCTINLIQKSKTAAFKNKVLQSYQKKFGTTCSFYKVKLSQGTYLLNS